MHYTLDANILINMERLYPREFFASLWDAVEASVTRGEMCMCEVAHKELERGDDDLSPWVANVPGFVCKTTDSEFVTVAAISIDHPGWVQDQTNAGDPFVIAHAKDEGSVVVTEESRKGPGTIDKNQKIPNIADEHGVTCIKFFDLLRAQGWRF